MLTQQPTQSIAVLKVNFMDPTKKAERIAQCQSKVYNRTYRDQSIGAITELHDGLNLTVAFSDSGTKDVTDRIKGADVNVRFTKEQWQSLNARFHSMDAIGAYIEVVVDGNVEYGNLTVNGEEVMSLTVYVESVTAVEPMEIARVGEKFAEDDFFSNLERDVTKKSNRAQEVRAQSRAARQSVEAKSGTAESVRKKAKI